MMLRPEPEGIERIDELVRRLETGTDKDARDTARELLQALMQFHGAALEQLVAIVREGAGVEATMERLARDELVRSLLLLYGLHPVDIETRVREALDQTRPYLRSHGGDVALAGVEPDGTVRLLMQGSCHGCPSSAVTLKLAIEQAIRDAAPDVAAIVVEDGSAKPAGGPAAQPARPAPPAPLAVESAAGSNGNGHGAGDAAWESVPDLRRLGDSSAQVLPVGGRDVLFCRLGEAFYAYADRCPACDGGLARARIANRVLACPACGQFYDVVRAGRGLGRSDLHLDPFPLLVENGRARVALPRAHDEALAAAAAGTP